MNTVSLLKLLMALLLIGELTAAPLAATPARRSERAPTIASQQSEDDDEGVTFDSLLPASGYKLYVEVRNVGALLGSPEVRELFEPVSPLLEQMGEAVEFKLVRLVTDNADRLQHSRVMFALNPTDTSRPGSLLAFELDSEDAAEEFAARMQESFAPLASLVGKSDGSQAGAAEVTDHTASTPTAIRRAGKLVVLSLTPFTFKALRGKNDKLMSEDLNFRAARDHFYAEPLFIYYDMVASERHKEGGESPRQPSEEILPANVTQNTHQAQPVSSGSGTASAVAVPEIQATASQRAKVGSTPSQAPARNGRPAAPAPASRATDSSAAFADQDLLGGLLNLLLSGDGQAQRNDALAVALALENGSLAVRALLIGAQGAPVAPLPFLSLPVSGPPVASEAAGYLPADTGIFVAASIDWPRFYDLATQQLRTPRGTPHGHAAPSQAADVEARRLAFEKATRVHLVDVLATALGNEMALSVPVSYLSGTLFGRVPIKAGAAPAAPLLLVAVRDREALAPKLRPLLEAIGVKFANAKTTTEKVGEVEITSYSNLAYAFVNNYLLLAARAASIRQAIEARAHNATLATSGDFQSYTQWQPRAVVAQVYVSAAVLKGLFPDRPPSKNTNDEAVREFLARYRFDPEPVTYAASAEGAGAHYELRIPKRLLMRVFSETAATEVATRIPRNESRARGFLQSLQEPQKAFKTQRGRYATWDEIIAESPTPGDKEKLAGLVIFKDMIEHSGYKFEMTASSSGYEVTLTPVEYGKTGRLSFYTDQSGVIRAGDHQGKAASSSDAPMDSNNDN
jgi:Protein of unknown function (DUF3352)